MYTHVCVHVHTGHVTWSMSTLGVVAAVNGCVWVCCNGYAMTPALSRSVSQRTGWRSRAICPLVFPLVWILLAVPPQCHLGCSTPLGGWKNGSWVQRLTFKVFYFSITFIYSWRTLFIYKIHFIISTHPPFLQFLQDPSSRHAPISTVCCLIKVVSVWPVQNVLPLRATWQGRGDSLPAFLVFFRF